MDLSCHPCSSAWPLKLAQQFVKYLSFDPVCTRMALNSELIEVAMPRLKEHFKPVQISPLLSPLMQG